MRIVVESFKRLFNAEKLTEGQVKERVKNGKITKDEYKHITGAEYTA